MKDLRKNILSNRLPKGVPFGNLVEKRREIEQHKLAVSRYTGKKRITNGNGRETNCTSNRNACMTGQVRETSYRSDGKISWQ